MSRSARAALPLLLLALLCGASQAVEPAPDLETLMHHFAASRGVEASFREEKTLPLLAAPLVSEGVLYYAPPGRLVRFTTSPEATSLLVDGNRLRIEDGLGVEEIDLASHDSARQLIEQLLVLFRGDLAALHRDYDASFQADGDAWSLRLEPKGMRVRQVIREIRLSGQGPRLDEMVVRGAEGEVTRTTYGHVETDRPFRKGELAALFPAEGSPQPLGTREQPSTPAGGGAAPQPSAASGGGAAAAP